MAVDDEDAVFVNIVGNIDPVDVGRLGRSLNIDVLEDIDIDMDNHSRKLRTTAATGMGR